MTKELGREGGAFSIEKSFDVPFIADLALHEKNAAKTRVSLPLRVGGRKGARSTDSYAHRNVCCFSVCAHIPVCVMER